MQHKEVICPISGSATIKIRNVTIPNVRCTRLANGEYDIPLQASNITMQQTAQEHQKSIEASRYPSGPEENYGNN
jgi:hypothetical protein